MTAGNATFAASPFSLTASGETAACWAGRKAILAKLQRMHRSFSSRSDSSLDVIWANLGAGKSHALYHLAYLVNGQNGNPTNALTAFVEMPDQLRRFLDLYERIIQALPIPKVVQLILDSNSTAVPGDLRRCGNAIVHGAALERDIACQWLVGRRPTLRELKSATGIAARIEDDSRACDILSGIVTAMADTGKRLVVLLDEFQRVSLLQPQHRRESVLSNLRSVFSRNPRCFSLVLAVTSRIEQTAMGMLPEELRTLMGMRPGASLPEMSEDEALEFVIERFRYFRPQSYKGTDEAPFGRDALIATIKYIKGVDTARLIPRTLLQALAWVYDAVVVAPETVALSAETAVDSLAELRWDIPE